jgi:conjugative transfer signal peptidase TraF
LPRGLYALTEPERIAPGDIVSFPIPAAVQGLVTDRHYLPPGATLPKHVVAVEGDHVCLQGDQLLVNDRELAVVRRTDTRGRPLAPYPFCGPIPAGLVFVAASAPTSFDSRYFGPVARTSLRLARPLWTY